MPQIKVKEKDLSWYYRQREPGQLTVLMPGISSFGPIDRPVLVNDSNFYKTLGGRVSECPEDISFDMAESFVRSGIDVLFWRINFKSGDGTSESARATTGPLPFFHRERVEGYFYKGKFYSDESHQTLIGPSESKAYYDKNSKKLYYYKTWNTDSGQKEGAFFEFNSESADLSYLPFFSKLGGLTVNAKYPGTYGNRLSVKFVGSGDTVRYFVYRDVKSGGKSLEDGLVNFIDPLNDYYYETVNINSSYINFVVSQKEATEEGTSDVTKTSITATTAQAGFVYLSGGANFIKEEDASPSEVSQEEKELKALGLADEGGSSKDDEKPYKKLPLGIFIDNLVNSKDIFNELKDPLLYRFGVAVNGGFNDLASNSPSEMSQVDKLFVDLCQSKGNAVYLVDGLKTMSATEFYSYCGLPKATGEVVDGVTFNTSYAAAFGPWGSYKLVSNGSVRQLPLSYPFLVRWGQSLESGSPIWMAPAGVKRAQLNGLVRSTAYRVGSAVLDQWQNGEDLEDAYNLDNYSLAYKVNPVVELKQYGYVIYGNSTLLRNGADGSTSMLQSFSTRVLANVIKDRAFDISLTLQFDQIDDDLFAQFKTLMSVFMDQLKYGGALYDYEIIVDRSELTLDQLNSRTIPVRILISPNPAVENFIINLEISQAGVSFNDETTDSGESSTSENA